MIIFVAFFIICLTLAVIHFITMPLLHKTWDYIFSVINPSALVLFLLALMVAFIRDQWKLSRKMRNNQAHLLFWVTQIEVPVKMQAEAVKKFGEAIQQPDIIPSGINRVNLHIDKLKVLTPLDMVQTFINNKSGDREINNKLLYRISSEIDLLEKIQQANEANLEICKDMQKEYQGEWKENIQALHDWFRETAKEKNVLNNEYLAAVFKISEEGQQKFDGVAPENQKPLQWTKEYLLDPIELVTRQFKDYTARQPYMNDLMKHVFRLNATLERKRLNIGGIFGKGFVESANGMEESYQRLKTATEEISASNFKWWFLLD